MRLRDRSTSSADWRPRRPDAAALADAPAAGGLPCLNSNNCNEVTLPDAIREGLNRLTTNHRKSAFKLAKSVARLCSVHGIARVGFLTLTFSDHVTCPKEAGRRFHSLSTGVLSTRYVETICVLERMKSGRIHFHLLVVLSEDVRTGFSFSQAERGDYSSANEALRREWAFWRKTAREYGFGRTELLPVKSNEEGLSKYVGKYIAKHVGAREKRDKGVRLVRYSRGANIGSVNFMFASPRSRLWRHQVEKFARRNGCADLAALAEKFGLRWAYTKREEILAIEPDEAVIVAVRPATEDEGPDVVTLRDVWRQDRLDQAQRVADAAGVTHAEAFVAMFAPQLRDALQRGGVSEVRVGGHVVDSPDRSARKAEVSKAYAAALEASELAERKRLEALDDEGERVDRVILWRNGTIERNKKVDTL